MSNFFKSLRHLIEGADGELSLKRLMATVAFGMFVFLCPKLANENPELIITSLAGLIFALLGLTAYATIQQDKLRMPPPQPKEETGG